MVPGLTLETAVAVAAVSLFIQVTPEAACSSPWWYLAFYALGVGRKDFILRAIGMGASSSAGRKEAPDDGGKA